MVTLPSGFPRDPGDAWVEGPDGRRFWGRFGAAGLLVHHPRAGVLLQHRAEWSHHGGTWGLPGGARHEGEDAVAGALREAHEEAGVPVDDLRLAFSSVLDLGFWSYVTVAVEAVELFEPTIGDAESLELRWVPADEVEALPLHPGFAASWPALAPRLAHPSTLVVDAANVVGSRPDGWWRDRPGAAERLLERLARLAEHGVPAEVLGGTQPGVIWARIVVVLEGKASSAADPEELAAPRSSVRVVRAPGSGDDTIVEVAAAEPGAVVVTADRELAARVEAAGARVVGPSVLLGLLDALDSEG
ncbi:NUDIX domain-containing protein [Cnuibacter sp. UC19_7]|uniref:NUDIX domain-containing protein n=1 Tax=Cnuibacter sp. UC19_7 TaxID=3350166 RepID=UPI00366B1E99